MQHVVSYVQRWRLLGRELVRRHPTKSLTNHHDNNDAVESPWAVRARAIYELFTAAGNTLFRGFLDPDDVQACFNILDTWSQRKMGFDVAKLKVWDMAYGDASRFGLTY